MCEIYMRVLCVMFNNNMIQMQDNSLLSSNVTKRKRLIII